MSDTSYDTPYLRLFRRAAEQNATIFLFLLFLHCTLCNEYARRLLFSLYARLFSSFPYDLKCSVAVLRLLGGFSNGQYKT